MNRNKFSLMLFTLTLLFFVGGCKKNNDVGNAIYLANAGSGIISQRVTVDTSGAKLDITPRAVSLVDNNVNVSLSFAPEALDAYNAKWGTSYKALPQKFVALSANKAQITAGSAFANSVKLNISPLDSTLALSDKYAIAVSITNVDDNTPVLQASKTLIVLVDRVVFTAVPSLKNAYMSATYKTPYVGLKAWTFEWRANMNALTFNNQAMMMSYGDNTEFFTRFGDVVIKANQLQVKFGSYGQFSPSTEFQAQKWYHFAVVYNGSTAKWYANGTEILNIPISASFNFSSIQFGNNNTVGMVNEVRFWSVALSQAQIVNNMYAIDPKSNGLEGYWKMNEGSGNIFKDATGKGNDLTGSGNITWVKGVRMPAE